MQHEHTPNTDDPYGLSDPIMATILETGRVLGSTLELMELMQASISEACALTGLQTGAIYLLDRETVHLQATQPPLPADVNLTLLSAPLPTHPHIERCIRDRTILTIEDVATATMTAAERKVCETRHLKSILFVPLATDQGVAGAFILGATDSAAGLNDVDLHQVNTLASRIALAIDNAQLHETLARANVDPRQTYDDALSGWAAALEMRDHVTGGHSVRVGALTIRLATLLGVPDEDLEHMRRGVLLHDIGKMLVPDDVLLKAGPLSEEDWVIMRKHPETARDFMNDIEFLVPAIDIPYGHHERWDGTGYPQGSSGEGIPIGARIFAVVDVYDALTSNRPYREAWSREDAINHIGAEAGSHFDPAVVEVFLEVVSEGAGEEEITGP